ncbi:MAG: hypothetical protein KC422_25270 [Trueperaceae bacterium]|nr:hypothetical protein [Trueperaceae bacterium]
MAKVPVNPNLPLTPGVYEISAGVPGRDLSSYRYRDFEQGLKNQYGDYVQLLSLSINGEFATLKVKVLEQPSSSDASIMILPYIICATIIVAGFFLWRISTNSVRIVSVFKETTDSIGDKPVIQAGLGGAGLGVMFAGAAFMIYVISQSSRKAKR